MNNQPTKSQLKLQKIIQLFDKMGLSFASAARVVCISREQLNICLLRGEASSSTAQKLAAALSSYHQQDLTNDVFAAQRFISQNDEQCNSIMLEKIIASFARLRLSR